MTKELKKILVLDDEAIITDTLHSLLDLMMDCQVVTYNEPLKALSDPWLQDQTLDLIISDFMMPDLDGFEFLKASEKLHPNCLSILLTGYADKNNAIKCVNEINLYYYLEKPWQNEDLIKVIENAFEKQNLEKNLAQKVVALEQSNYDVKRLYDMLQSKHDDTINENSMLQENIIKRNFHLQTILDYVEEGFFMVNHDLKVQSEYSKKCLDMFHKPIDNQWLPSLLYEEDQDKQNFINDLLKDIIHNKSMRALFLPLLPEKIVLNKVPYAIQFYLIEDLIHESLTNEKVTFIVTLKDISEAIALKSTLDEERNQLEMLLEVYRNSNGIKAAIKDYHHFSEQITDLLTQKLPDHTKLKIIFRQVHTFKGMFSQMKFVESVKHLHAIEDKLNDIEKTGLYQRLKHIDFSDVLNDDLEFFKEKLGLDISSLQEEVVVKKSKLIEFESHLKTYGKNQEIKTLLEELQSIRAKSFKSLLEQYDHYIQDLSEKLNKPMDAFVVTGDDILVDHEIYRDFSNSLIHVIRNTMDHGIESQEERQASQKPLSGSIKAIVNLRDHMIQVTLENDGQAIDLENIKQSAIQKGYDIKSYSDQAILQLIFEQDISTKDSVTKLSGRGVGLAAVKYELERLGGRVDITSTDQKTAFTFALPLYKGILSKKELEKTFGRSVALYLDRYESKFSVSDQSCTLNDQWCGVKLPFTGLYQGDLLIYFEKENLIEFVKKHGFNEGDWQDYSKEVLKEVANTMIGNGLALLPGAGNLVELGLPEKIDISSEIVKGYMIELEYMRIMIKLL